jgi:hypothetical protein
MTFSRTFACKKLQQAVIQCNHNTYSMSACANCAPIQVRTHWNATQASTRYTRALKTPSLRVFVCNALRAFYHFA